MGDRPYRRGGSSAECARRVATATCSKRWCLWTGQRSTGLPTTGASPHTMDNTRVNSLSAAPITAAADGGEGRGVLPASHAELHVEVRLRPTRDDLPPFKMGKADGEERVKAGLRSA